MTVGQLIAALSPYSPDLPVVIQIETDGPAMLTFVTDADVSVKHAKQTYLGDIDYLRVGFQEDEP